MDMSTSTGTFSTMVSTSTAIVASATPTGMHMNMGGDTSCKLSMLFNWNVIDACFLSSSWRITSRAMFAGSCISVTLLVMFLEFIRRLQRSYERSVAQSSGYQQIGPDGVSLLGGEQGTTAAEGLSSDLKRGMLQPSLLSSSSSPIQTRRGFDGGSGSGSGIERPGFRDAVVRQAVRALLHTAGFAVAYLVMLMAMYFNGYIIMCILVGAFLGSFVFSWDQLRLPSARISYSSTGVTGCCE